MKCADLIVATLLLYSPALTALPGAPPPPNELAEPITHHELIVTAETVQQAVTNAKCGDRIELSGEFPPVLKLHSLKPTCPVVIDGSKTNLHNVSIVGSSNFILVNGRFLATKYASINVIDSSNINIRDNNFDSPGTAAVAVSASHYVWISHNRVEASSGDGFDLAASQFIVISDNVCANNIVTPTHPDCVQAWDIRGKDLVSDVWITNNTAIGPTQGFDGFDHGDGGFDRIYILHNTISTTSIWAGQFNACRHCVMIDNMAITMNGQPRGWGGARWFMTDADDDKTPDSGKSGNIIRNNENGMGH